MPTNNQLEIIIVLLVTLIVILPYLLKNKAIALNLPGDDMHDSHDKPFYYA